MTSTDDVSVVPGIDDTTQLDKRSANKLADKIARRIAKLVEYVAERDVPDATAKIQRKVGRCWRVIFCSRAGARVPLTASV
jgi:hypothetical protein